MKKLFCFICILSALCIAGCAPQEYKIDEQKQSYVTIKHNAYMLAGERLKTIDKSKYEKSDTVYYVKDEEELVQVLQYNIEIGNKNVAFQTEGKMDLDLVANRLSYLNPFDIGLQLSTTDYKNQKDQLLYKSSIIEIQNLDDRYEQALYAAKRAYNEIISEGMDNDQKIKAIHDYLVKSIIYDESAANQKEKQASVFKAAGALVDKVAVCSGYSRAFMMLAKMADVPAIYVASDVMNHGWNLVYGNNGWRFIDITWDDPVPDQLDHVEYQFLNLSISDFITEGSHMFDSDKNADFYLTLANAFFNKNE